MNLNYYLIITYERPEKVLIASTVII